MKLYGIIGYPLAQSASPAFFNNKFDTEGIDARYIPFEIESTDELPRIIEQHPELCGFNVTIPHKVNVMQHLAGISDEAKAINAVNVVKVETREDGSKYLKGYNTDWYGFTASFKPLINDTHKKALVLGTGGASKAIAYSLELLGISYKFVSRSASEDNYTYDDLTEEVMKEHTVLINTSPVGTFPNVKECPNIPYHCITREHVVYDLIYNPIETMFLRQAETCGATIQNGWPMFVNQALKSYEIWEGVMWKE
jgi:shikimate dehydrogenase